MELNTKYAEKGNLGIGPNNIPVLPPPLVFSEHMHTIT